MKQHRLGDEGMGDKSDGLVYFESPSSTLPSSRQARASICVTWGRASIIFLSSSHID